MDFQTRESLEQYLESIRQRMEETDPVATYVKEKYTEIEEKLPNDMKSMSTQYLLLFGLILEEADINSEFGKSVLLSYKNWDRLYQFLDKKARPTSKDNKNYRPNCAMVDSITLLGWIKEYYALDDKEDFEKEQEEIAKKEADKIALNKRMEEMKKKAAENTAKRKAGQKASGTEKSLDDVSEEDETDNETEEVAEGPAPVEKKKSTRDCVGQIDFFSLLAN